MPVNKSANIRYQTIDRCLRNSGRRYTLLDLIGEIERALEEEYPEFDGISERSVKGDLRYMRSDVGYSAPIEAYKEGKKYYYRYSDPKFSINNAPLSQTEIDKIKSALAVLNRFEGSPEFEWTNEIIPILEDQFGLKSDNNQKVISYDSDSQDYSGNLHIPVLFNAIVNKKVLQLTYKTFKGEEFDYLYHPYYLKQYNNRWFCLGYNETTKIENWTVPLDRIISISPQDTEYRTSDVDWGEYFLDFIGATKPEGGELTEIVLRFTPFAAPYVVTKPIHPYQKRPEYTEDGHALIRFEVIPNAELISRILQYGSGVEVLSPKSLRDQIALEVRTMNSKYQS